jgi:two-component sensor histidine kinase
MNALKHAFPVNKKGVIRVELVTSKEAVALSVSDNGVGFPKGVNPVTADTMGLHLVRMLTRQIGGELSFVKKKGVQTLVKFGLQ